MLLPVTIASFAVGLAAQRPLPDRDAFLAAAQERIRSNDQLARQYTFVRTETKFERDERETLVASSVKVFEVVPNRGGLRFERLVSVDGEAVPANELARQEHEHDKRVAEHRRRRERESPRARARREAEERRERDEAAAGLDEVFEALHFEMKRRETVDGRPAIVVFFSPVPEFRARTDMGRMVGKAEGYAWVDEESHEIVRVTATLRETLSFGWGVLARVHEGSTFEFERRLVDGASWLPLRVRVRATGRALLLKKIRVDELTEYSGFRRLATDDGGVEDPLPDARP